MVSEYRVAMNLCWPEKKENIEYDFRHWLLKCEKNSIRIIRIMLTSWGMNSISDKADRLILLDICRKAVEHDIEIIITLNTYVNFQKITLRDFEDSSYSWDKYVYAYKYKKIQEFFLDDVKEQEYVKDVIELLNCIKPYKSVSRIELFNEIDQLGLLRKKAVSWTDKLNDYLVSIYNYRYEFFVSIANYKKYFEISRKTKLNCDLHFYSFPYSTMVGNLKFIQNTNLNVLVLEYAKYSDYSYSETPGSKTYFAAGLWGGYLMDRKQSPASWWWYDILKDDSYIRIIQYFLKNHQLYTSLKQGKYGSLNFQPMNMDERKKEDAGILKSKIQERLKNLLLNPRYIFYELAPIIKYVMKKKNRENCRRYDYLSFEAPGIQLFLIETYGKHKVSSVTWNQNNIGEIHLIDLINCSKKVYEVNDEVENGIIVDGCNILIYYL